MTPRAHRSTCVHGRRVASAHLSGRPGSDHLCGGFGRRIWRRFDVWPVCLRVVPGPQQHLGRRKTRRAAWRIRHARARRRGELCFRQTEVGTGMGGQRSRRSRTCWREEGREPGKAHDGASQPAAAVASGRAKVGGARAQLRAPSSVEKHVFRFQISVDDADEVQRGEARGDLADDFSRVRFRQFPLALEQPEQGASRQQLKNQLHLRGRFEGVDKLRVVAVAAWRWSPVAGRRRRRIHT